MRRRPESQGAAATLTGDIATGWATETGADVLRGREARDAPAGQQYLGVPFDMPRVLLPLGQPRAAAGSLLANLPLRRRRDRLRRRALALGVRTLPDLLAPRGWLGAASVDTGPTLLATLQESWDERVSALSFTVRAATPNYKPTFLAVDGRGRVLGYGKIAPNEGTQVRARSEAAGLRWMHDADVPRLRAPEVLAELTWRGCLVVVVSPLPPRSRRYPVDDRAPAHLLDHARSTGRTIRVSAVAEDLLSRIAAAGDTEVHDAASRRVASLDSSVGELSLPAGRLHGDWVPWNLGVHAGDVWAWDWEHTEAESAVGLDLVHWHVLVHRDRRRTALADAINPAEAAATADLRTHGVRAEAAQALLALGRLRVVARACSLHAASGLWVEGERAAVLDLLRVTVRTAAG